MLSGRIDCEGANLLAVAQDFEGARDGRVEVVTLPGSRLEHQVNSGHSRPECSARGTNLQALPVFWLGIMLILIFSVQLRWLPTGTLGEGMFSWKHYVMPTVTLGWIASATYLRLTRSSMLEVLDSEYVKLARAKGVSNNAVIWKHAFRNALIAPLTFSSLLLTGFITGAVVTETIFSIPGLGRLAFEAINNNDFPIMVGTVLVFTGMYVGFNFVTDLLYAYIDPRIRYA